MLITPIMCVCGDGLLTQLEQTCIALCPACEKATSFCSGCGEKGREGIVISQAELDLVVLANVSFEILCPKCIANKPRCPACNTGAKPSTPEERYCQECGTILRRPDGAY